MWGPTLISSLTLTRGQALAFAPARSRERPGRRAGAAARAWLTNWRPNSWMPQTTPEQPSVNATRPTAWRRRTKRFRITAGDGRGLGCGFLGFGNQYLLPTPDTQYPTPNTQHP